MRIYSPAAQAIRERGGMLIERRMIWLAPRDRESGALASVGFWEGRRTADIEMVDLFTGVSAVRTFQSGGILSIGSILYEAGIKFTPVTVQLSSILPAVQLAFRGYEARGAKVQIVRRCYDPDTRQPVGIEPVFKGYVDSATVTRPVPGGAAVLTASLVSTARLLTITSERTRSDEAQRLRGGDRFYRYAAEPGEDTPWGTDDR